MLTKKQTAEKLGVHISTIDRWMKDRKIPYLNLHGTIRFDEVKIQNWLNNREVRATSLIK